MSQERRPPEDELTPAEERLLRLLALLQLERQDGGALTHAVMWRVRLQYVARGLARAVAQLAAAVADGLSLVLKLGDSRSARGGG